MDFARFSLFAGALVRYVVTLVAGVMVGRGVLQQGDAPEWVTAAVAMLVPLLWSLYQKANHQTKLEAAAQAPAATPLPIIEAQVRRDGVSFLVPR